MDQQRFDDLTRTLGKATSRRQVLKGIAGGLAASILGQLRPGQAGAAPAAPQASCSQAAVDDCNKRALRFQATCNRFCRLAQLNRLFNNVGLSICRSNCNRNTGQLLEQCNQLGCPGGTSCCDGTCFDVSSDPSNCGRCGNQCASDQVCSRGYCVCPDGLEECGGQCVDPRSNPYACGGCTNLPCDECEACVEGICQPLNCGDGKVCCHHACVDAMCQGGQTFNSETCQCECAPVSCPPGHAQDPITCECGDLCAGVECGVCESCDPSTGQCAPVPEGNGCGSNLVCCKGNCVSTDCPPGQQFDQATCKCACTSGETCGPFCCAENKVCCPDVVSGMSCRDPDPTCPGCTFSCGDKCCPQDQYCCRAADYSYHCVANSGDSC